MSSKHREAILKIASNANNLPVEDARTNGYAGKAPAKPRLAAITRADLGLGAPPARVVLTDAQHDLKVASEISRGLVDTESGARVGSRFFRLPEDVTAKEFLNLPVEKQVACAAQSLVPVKYKKDDSGSFVLDANRERIVDDSPQDEQRRGGKALSLARLFEQGFVSWNTQQTDRGGRKTVNMCLQLTEAGQKFLAAGTTTATAATTTAMINAMVDQAVEEEDEPFEPPKIVSLPAAS